MLRHFLTHDVYQRGIVRYLRKYSYKNAHNQDLWDSLTNVWAQTTFNVQLTVWSSVILLEKKSEGIAWLECSWVWIWDDVYMKESLLWTGEEGDDIFSHF